MPTKKIISKDALHYLNHEWNIAKSSGWTQKGLANKLGIAQATVSQYIGGKIPLNTNFLVNVAKLLKLNASQLGVEEISDGIGQPKKLLLRVIMSTSGLQYKEKLLAIAGTVDNRENAFLVEVDSEDTEFQMGSHLICEKTRVGNGQRVCAIKADKVLVGTLKTDGQSWFVIHRKNGETSKYAIDKSWDVSKVTGVVLPEQEPDDWF